MDMNIMEQDGLLDFSKSILGGVEIKRCRGIPYAYKSHVHNELSLGYIAEGATELTLSDTVLKYEAGDGVIIPPLFTHRCAPRNVNHWAYVMLFVDPAYYGDAVIFPQAKKLTGSNARRLTGFIKQLLAEEDPDALESILIELLLEFGEKDMPEAAAINTSDAVRAIHDYLIHHVKDEVTLDQLACISGLNKFSVIRNFKKQYITTPAAFHLQFRVAEAKRLLSGGADVLDVCEALRFYDQAHLIREFKKMYGITPAAYAKQVR